MAKPILAVDIDEVLFPFVTEFAAHHNQKYGTQLSQQDFWTYRFEEVIGISLEEILERVYAFHDAGYENIEPLADAYDVLRRLTEKFDIAILTARNAYYREKTEAWLKENFSELNFHSITMIGYEEDQGQSPRTKAEVCVEINAFALVDDSLKYLTEAAKVGIQGVLFGDYPWNQADALPTGVVRVGGWQDLAVHFGV